jgi:hypothetical protein
MIPLGALAAWDLPFYNESRHQIAKGEKRASFGEPRPSPVRPIPSAVRARTREASMTVARDLAAIPLVEPGDGAELDLRLVRADAAVSPSCSVLLRPSL